MGTSAETCNIKVTLQHMVMYCKYMNICHDSFISPINLVKE